MPKVSQEHRDARRAQIVDAARTCFAERGFHRASMHDVCACAGISAGAIYSYFTGKEALVQAMCAEGRAEGVQIVADAVAAGATLEAFERLLAAYFESPSEKVQLQKRIYPQLWAEAAHSDVIREVLREGLGDLRSVFAMLVRAAQDEGDIAAHIDAEAAATVMIAIFQGFLVQRSIDPSLNVMAYTNAVRALFTNSFWIGAQPAGAPGASAAPTSGTTNSATSKERLP